MRSRSRSPGTKNVLCIPVTLPRGNGMVPSAACCMQHVTMHCQRGQPACSLCYVRVFFSYGDLWHLCLSLENRPTCWCVYVHTWCGGGGGVCYFVVRCICEIGCLQWTVKCSWSVLSIVNWWMKRGWDSAAGGNGFTSIHRMSNTPGNLQSLLEIVWFSLRVCTFVINIS